MTRAGYELWYEPRCTFFTKKARVPDSWQLRTYYLTRNRLLYARRNLKGAGTSGAPCSIRAPSQPEERSAHLRLKVASTLLVLSIMESCAGLFMSSSNQNKKRTKTRDTMNIIDWILYIPLALCVCYLLPFTPLPQMLPGSPIS